MKAAFYEHYGPQFNDCIKQVFGADARSIPQQTIQNAPFLDARLSRTGTEQPCEGGPTSRRLEPTKRRPPWDGVHSSEPIYSNGPNGTNAIFGSYAHELANILGERLSPLGTSGGQPYGMTYGNPGEPEGDPDIGAQVEICVLVRCSTPTNSEEARLMRVVKFILSVSMAMYGAAVNAVPSQNEECGNAHADGQLGPLVIKPLDKEREKNLGCIREFIWSHWRQREKGQVTATCLSSRGDQASTHLRLSRTTRGS